MRALLFLCTALLAAPAFASSALVWRLEEMARVAEVVALAKVESAEGVWREGRIFTRVRLSAEQLMKGAPGGALMVETPGGVVGGIGQDVAGAPRFEVGERVAVFLVKHPRHEVFRVVGLAQGKLRVEGAEVVRDLRGMRLLVPDPAGDLVVAPNDGPDRRPLDTFVREVATALAK